MSLLKINPTKMILTIIGIFLFLMLSPMYQHVEAASVSINGCTFDDSIPSEWSLQGNCTVTARIDIPAGTTVDGGGHTMHASFDKTTNSNNAALGIIGADNVTVENLTIDGTSGNPLHAIHGINTYKSVGVVINNVVLTNMGASGIVVNGSTVSVSDVTTSGSGWHGINVDQGSDGHGGTITEPSVLNIDGIMHQTDLLQIYVDDTTKDVTVNDNLPQYILTAPAFGSVDALYTLDTEAPSIPVLTWPMGYITDNTPLMQWDDSTDNLEVAGYYYRVYYNCSDESAVPATCASLYPNTTGVWRTVSEYQAGTTSDGTYFWQVMAKDTAGNTSDWSGLEKVVIDTTAPAAPTITAPGANTWHNTSPILDKWTAVTDPSGIDHYQIAYNYDDGHSFGGSSCPGQTITGYSGFIGCRDLTGLQRNHTPGLSEEGGVTIWVRAVDGAGNVGPWSDSVHYYYDHTAPDAFNVTPANGTFTNGASIYQEWGSSATDIDHFIYESYNDGAGISLRWTNTFNGTNKTATNIGEAEYWWRVKAVDMAGNESPWTNLWKVTVDNTAPLVELSSPPNAGLVSGLLDIEGFVTDNVMLSHYNMSLYPSTTDLSDGQTHSGDRLNDSSWCTTPTSGTVLLTTNFVGLLCNGWDTSAYPDGDYQIRLAARDAASNRDTTSPFTGGDTSVHVINITIDNTAPTTDAGPDAGTVSAAFTQTGTTTDTNGVATTEWSVVSGPGTVTFGNTAALSTLVSADTDGLYTIQLEATDTLGNASTDTFTFTWFTPAPAVLGITTSNSDGTSGTVFNPNVASFTPAPVVDDEGEVAGAQDANNENSGEVIAATTTSAQADTGEVEDGCFEILSICWYWWLLSIPVIVFIWWIVTREDEE